MGKVINGVRSAGEFAVDFLKGNPSWQNRPLDVGVVQGIAADRGNEFAVRLAEIAETLNTLGPDAAMGAIERTYETLTGGIANFGAPPQKQAIRLDPHRWTTVSIGIQQLDMRPCEGGVSIMTLDGTPLLVRPIVQNKVAVIVDHACIYVGS